MATPSINSLGLAALNSSAPDPLKRTLATLPGGVSFTSAADKSSVVANYSGKAASGGFAGVDLGNPNTIHVMDPKSFSDPANTGQLAVHEAMHLMQNNLAPSVQAKIPADNPNDPYNYGGDKGLQKARSKGKTLLDLPREQQAAVLQYYTAKNDHYQKKVADGTATKQDHTDNKKLQETYKPWINDLNSVPLSTIEPTSPDAKGNTINTTVRPTAGPATNIPGMQLATEIYGPNSPAPGQGANMSDFSQYAGGIYATPQGPGTSSVPGGSPPPGGAPGSGLPAMDALQANLAKRQELVAQASQLYHETQKPVAGGSALPGSLISPGGGGNTISPLLTAPTGGARNNRRQGIANTIIGAANLLGQISNAKAQQEEQKTTVDTTRVLQASQAITDAKNALAIDPNNEEAKKNLKTNNDLINMMDPKARDRVAKALDISFVDPSKNNKPEHKAGQAAIKSYAEQLQAQLPQTLAPNQAAQAKYEEKKAEIKALDEVTAKLAPVATGEAHDVAGIREANIKAEADAKKTEALNAFDKWKTDAEIKAKHQDVSAVGNFHLRGIEIAQSHADARTAEVVDGALQRAQGKIENMHQDDLVKSDAAIQKAIAANQKAIPSLEALVSAQQKRMNRFLHTPTDAEKKELKQSQDMLQAAKDDISQLQGIGGQFTSEIAAREAANNGNKPGVTAATIATAVAAPTADDSDHDAAFDKASDPNTAENNADRFP